MTRGGAVAAALLFIGIVSLCYCSESYRSDLERHCAARGGVLVLSGQRYHCMDRNLFR